MRDFEYNIVAIMQEAGVSQSELSSRSGIPRTSINRYVKGADMPASVAKAIARALGVTVDELLGLTVETMPLDEQELLAYYRNCSVRGKANLLEYAEDTARRHPKNPVDTAAEETA